WSAHYLGTCRMGNDPKTSVVDPWCRSHDVANLFIADGSVFVTGAAVNPALTISALATRTAEGIVAAFNRRQLYRIEFLCFRSDRFLKCGRRILRWEVFGRELLSLPE